MLRWTKLNTTFDAEPNAPEPRVEVSGTNILVRFRLNPFIWDDVDDDDEAILTFHDVHMFRLGSTNDEGFYRGQCRFSGTGISWGDFYELQASDWQTTFPADRHVVQSEVAPDVQMKHYLFYLRDETFECIAGGYDFERVGMGT